jgi:hypothetical protein
MSRPVVFTNNDRLLDKIRLDDVLLAVKANINIHCLLKRSTNSSVKRDRQDDHVQSYIKLKNFKHVYKTIYLNHANLVLQY